MDTKEAYKTLKKIKSSIIADYLETYTEFKFFDASVYFNKDYNYVHVAEDFWHGDFDVEQFLKAIGPLGADRVKAALNG